MVKNDRGLLFEFERTCIYTWVNLNLKLVCCMRRKLCLGSCSLVGSRLYLLLLVEISTFFSSTSLVARRFD